MAYLGIYTKRAMDGVTTANGVAEVAVFGALQHNVTKDTPWHRNFIKHVLWSMTGSSLKSVCCITSSSSQREWHEGLLIINDRFKDISVMIDPAIHLSLVETNLC